MKVITYQKHSRECSVHNSRLKDHSSHYNHVASILLALATSTLPTMPITEHHSGLDLNQYHLLGCALYSSAIEAFSGASHTKFEEYLHTRTNKSRLTLEK